MRRLQAARSREHRAGHFDRRQLADVVEHFGIETKIMLDRVLSGETAPPVEPPMEMPAPDRIEGEEWLEPVDPVEAKAAE